MICEKCGAQMQDTVCPKCGHHVALMGYSRELERLFNGGTPPLRGESEPDLSSTPEPVKPELVKPEPVKPAPIPPEPVKPEPIPPETEPLPKKRLWLLIASAVVLLAGVGIIAGVLGNQSGTRAGIEQAKATYEPQLTERYHDGITTGILQATATYEPQLEEQYNTGKDAGIQQTEAIYQSQLEEQYNAGKNAGIEQAEATYMPLLLEQYNNGFNAGKTMAEAEPSSVPSPSPSPEAQTTETTINLDEDPEESLPPLIDMTETIFLHNIEEPEEDSPQAEEETLPEESVKNTDSDQVQLLRLKTLKPSPKQN